MNRLLIQLFRILVSILFVFSAITKLLSLAFFDGLVAELFLGVEYYNNPDGLFWTQLLSRIIISGELLLAVAVLHDHLLKQVVLPVIQLILVGFTVHLTYVGFQKGFIGENCGCFGDIIPMDNAQSIIKNVITILMVAYIQWKYKENQNLNFKSWVPTVVVGAVTFSTLYLTIKEYKTIETASTPTVPTEVTNTSDTPVITNVDTSSKAVIDTITKDSATIDTTKEMTKNTSETSTDTKVEANSVHTIKIKKNTPENVVKSTTTTSESKLLAKYTQFSSESNVNLNQGEKLICMFSLSCGHCQQSYKELVALSKENKIPPMYLICYGKKFDLGFFFSQAGGKDPYYLMNDYTEFERLLAGSDFPKILLRKDGTTKKFWDLESYKIESVRNELGIKAKKKEEKSSELDLGTGSEFGTGSGGMFENNNEELDF